MEIKNIKKSYGKKLVLKDINLDLKKGQCIGILGGNGSGKSTLLNILAGVQRCDAGNFMFNNKDLLSDSVLRSQVVGFVPQSPPLIDELSAKDNLRLWYTHKEMKQSLSGGVLDLLGINDFIKTTVSKMSGGMKKRLAVGCAVAHNPEILLLDEPSAALDLVCKKSIYDYIKSFKNNGGTVIMATHDVQELSLCDNLYILGDGILSQYIYDGNTDNLITKLKK
ncbi:MAG: ABC transporter ATP-binding protein [Clostridia bacterium]|nr:ABC transporter ATP-binding protein [Clostridia bacterium]